MGTTQESIPLVDSTSKEYKESSPEEQTPVQKDKENLESEDENLFSIKFKEDNKEKVEPLEIKEQVVEEGEAVKLSPGKIESENVSALEEAKDVKVQDEQEEQKIEKNFADLEPVKDQELKEEDVIGIRDIL